MASFALKIGPVGSVGSYDDGDIIEAINSRKIRWKHAEGICSVRHVGVGANGLRPAGTLAEHYLAETHQYRFVRVSRTETKRITLATGEEEIFGPEYGDLALFIRRRLAHSRHRIFGQPGAEVWYGGHKDFGHAAMDRVWAEIEHQTDKRAGDHTRWPYSPLERQCFLILPVDDFSDAELREYKSSIMRTAKGAKGDYQELVKKRKHHVRYKVGLGLSIGELADVGNRAKAVDLRDTKSPFARAAIVLAKAVD